MYKLFISNDGVYYYQLDQEKSIDDLEKNIKKLDLRKVYWFVTKDEVNHFRGGLSCY